PGGIAVDLDAAARRQHEAAMGPAEPAAQSLVQIAGAAAMPAAAASQAPPTDSQSKEPSSAQP
ncbi:MAG: hypothetical protein WCA37_08460, partial [Terracidiphilus sp.]